MRILLFLITFIALNTLNAQISRGELEKEVAKGLEMLKTGKFEDAIGVFDNILKKDPTEGKALLLRARTKYELLAYKGTKKDCLAYMDIYGIDDQVAGLLGKTEKALENYKQALAYLKVAIFLKPSEVEYLLDRAEILYNLGLDEQACEDWTVAMENGSTVAEKLFDENCAQFIKVEAPVIVEIPVEQDSEEIIVEGEMSEEEISEEEISEEEMSMEENNQVSNSNENNSENEESIPEIKIDSSMVKVEKPVDSYPIDDKVEKIVIDDELTIILADGIGSRKLMEVPDILILSDKSGEVVVNVCIDRLGRIDNPVLNEEASTIKTKSLVSLALRESSNFRFARSSRKNHCGTITFIITGSEE